MTLTLYNALAGQDHDGSEGNAKNGILSKVESGEACGGLEGPLLVLGQSSIISLCLVLLVIEVLGGGKGRMV